MIDEAHKIRETERYMAAMHRVQTAIAFRPDKKNQEPKHLRTGIDMSKADMGGLATLLIEKGVFTTEEYLTAIADSAEREADNYEDELSTVFGINIKTM